MRLLLLVLLTTISFSTEAKSVRPITQRDTILLTDTILIKKEMVQKSEYYQLFEKLIEQKQQGYDSTLNFLNWIAGILAVLFTLIISIGVFLGFNEFRQIKRELKEQLESKKNEIEKNIQIKLFEESKKVADQLISDKYEEEMTDLKERASNLESISKQILDSYVLRFNKEKPELKELKEKGKSTNPFKNI
jgi:hypothetical protein